jgi:hypothetical protein
MPKPTWGTAANPFVSVRGLPPSHSEISKDHPPHTKGGHDDKLAWQGEWDQTGHEGEQARHAREQAWDYTHGHQHNEHEEEHSHEDLAGGSTFYALHRRLAVEADRHLMAQVEAVWGQGNLGDDRVDPRSMEIDEQQISADANRYSWVAAAEAAQRGHRFAQNDTRVNPELRNRAEVRQLLALVDYFISHPAAATWWKPIVDRAIAEDAPGLYAQILSRNKTRKRRDTPV